MKKFVLSLFFGLFITFINAQTVSIDAVVSLDELTDFEDFSLLDVQGNHSILLDLSKYDDIKKISVEDLNGKVVFEESLSDLPHHMYYQLDLTVFDEGYYTVAIAQTNGTIYEDIRIK
jgi:hypothetical protein